jgi:tripartite-type tricarboxylate transporter receptor subunit TctC
MRTLLMSLAITSTVVGAYPVQGEERWPSRPVNMISPFPPGSGSTDVVARLMAEKLRDMWNQSVVVQNVPGAAGSVGIARLAKSPKDGYTIATSGDAAIVVNVSLYKSLAYDPINDLVPIALIGRTPNLLVVNDAKGWRSLADLVDTARAKPGTVGFTSNGYGTSQHMAIEQLKLQAKIDVLHAPNPQAGIQNIIGGHVDAGFQNITVALPLARAGAVRVLAQTGRNRSTSVPDVPTVAELGFPGFEAVAWAGLFAPAGTPEAIVQKIAADVAAALADDAFRSRLTHLGVEIAEPGTPQSFRAFIAAEIPRVAKLIHVSGIKLD